MAYKLNLKTIKLIEKFGDQLKSLNNSSKIIYKFQKLKLKIDL